jgi:[ribosomal protein S5]-alanine N-acetyltransferase
VFIHMGEHLLRRPEPKDIEALYAYRNDLDIVHMLGGFSRGFSKSDLGDWIERHRKSTEDLVWIIANGEDHCVGHCGLYKIDLRNGTAEVAICIGDASLWGRGLGEKTIQTVVNYAFQQMNLRRIKAEVLATNLRSARMVEKCGFTREGIAREEEYRDGYFVDKLVFGLLRNEWKWECPK